LPAVGLWVAKGEAVNTSRVLIVGSDATLSRLLGANLEAPGRELVVLDPAVGKPPAWARADVVVVDVGRFSPELLAFHINCLMGCRASGGRVVLLYDPPWPSARLAQFGAAGHFAKPASLGQVAQSVSQLLEDRPKGGAS